MPAADRVVKCEHEGHNLLELDHHHPGSDGRIGVDLLKGLVVADTVTIVGTCTLKPTRVKCHTCHVKQGTWSDNI
jgi:hypothetical protein